MGLFIKNSSGGADRIVPNINSGSSLPSSGIDGDIFLLKEGSKKIWPEIITNGNGTAVRWESGFQICYSYREFRDVTWQAWGSLFETVKEYDLGYFATGFVSTPYVFAQNYNPASGQGQGAWTEWIRNTSVDRWGLTYFVRPNVGGAALNCCLMAIGRWK